MQSIIPEKLKALAQALPKPLYIVGGACRDFLAEFKNSSEKDWDICAALSPKAVKKAAIELGFDIAAVYKNTGTAKLCADGEEYEFTSFRTDRYVRGTHMPEKVCFTNDIYADARRRDFKCNAVYYDITGGRFVDPLGGMNDIAHKRISTVAPAEKVFGEDGLRLLRLCRIAAETGFVPDKECIDGAKRNARLISDIVPERICAEIRKILIGDMRYNVLYGQYYGMYYFFDIGLGEYILPELADGKGMKQNSVFHDYDVLEHSLRCVKYSDPSIRLAALFHDVGKPLCMKERMKFAGHEKEGADAAVEIFKRLRFPKREAHRACELIKYHMYDYDCRTKENKVRRFIVMHWEIIDDLLKLKQADYSACKDDLSPAPTVVKWKEIMQKMQAEGAPFTLSALAVRGDELIEAGIPPRKTGKILACLLGECAINPKLNRKDKLVKLAYEIAEGKFN